MNRNFAKIVAVVLAVLMAVSIIAIALTVLI